MVQAFGIMAERSPGAGKKGQQGVQAEQRIVTIVAAGVPATTQQGNQAFDIFFGSLQDPNKLLVLYHLLQFSNAVFGDSVSLQEHENGTQGSFHSMMGAESESVGVGRKGGIFAIRQMQRRQRSWSFFVRKGRGASP